MFIPNLKTTQNPERRKPMSDISCAHCGEPWDSYEVFHEFEDDEKELFLAGDSCPSCFGKTIQPDPQAVEAWAESLLEATDDPDPLLERIEHRFAQIQKPSL
jgi:hypothetical protein